MQEAESAALGAGRDREPDRHHGQPHDQPGADRQHDVDGQALAPRPNAAAQRRARLDDEEDDQHDHTADADERVDTGHAITRRRAGSPRWPHACTSIF